MWIITEQSSRYDGTLWFWNKYIFFSVFTQNKLRNLVFNHNRERFFMILTFSTFSSNFYFCIIYCILKLKKIKSNFSIVFFCHLVVHYLGISFLFNILVLKIKGNCKILVIKFYKAILHLKHSNFPKQCAMTLKF